MSDERKRTTGERFSDLVGIMDRLRGEGGCPWDREQKLENLKTYILEEVYEVMETIDSRDASKLREEMGDLLFQVIFITRIMKEDGHFTIDDVLDEITTKMKRRHPHIFGESNARTSEEVLVQWESIKAREKQSESIFNDVQRSLPALLHSNLISSKASRVGFDWPTAAAVVQKVREELGELERELAEPRGRVQEEIGDLLFASANLARLAGVDPEDALRQANLKFVRRFQWIEGKLREEGEKPSRAINEKMEMLWEQAKRQETPSRE
ncbi:MAG: nucleoside triphosphate pyrophosphohydrolase [Acidobacteriota bacterium]